MKVTKEQADKLAELHAKVAWAIYTFNGMVQYIPYAVPPMDIIRHTITCFEELNEYIEHLYQQEGSE